MLLQAAGDLGGINPGDHVHLTANPELSGEVGTGLNGEAGSRQEDPLIVCFQIIEMGSTAMEDISDIVARAVREGFAEAACLEHGAGSVIGLEAGDWQVAGKGVADLLDRRVPSVTNGGEDGLLARGWLPADDAGPGDVVEAGAGPIHPAPDIDQNEGALLDQGRGISCRFIVRVCAVGAGAHVGPVVPDDARTAQRLAEPLHHAPLVGLAGGTDASANLSPGFGQDIVDMRLRLEVGRDLLLGENSFEVAHEIGRAADLLAEFAQHLDGAGIDHADVHDGVARGVLHGEAACAGQHGSERRFELLPGGVLGLCSGQRVEAAGFDAVDELLRLPMGGNQVVPAPCDVQTLGQAEDAVGQGIAAVVIIEEPAVQAGITEGGLDGLEVHEDYCRAVPLPLGTSGPKSSIEGTWVWTGRLEGPVDL